jgi:hypothetical protein
VPCVGVFGNTFWTCGVSYVGPLWGCDCCIPDVAGIASEMGDGLSAFCLQCEDWIVAWTCVG